MSDTMTIWLAVDGDGEVKAFANRPKWLYENKPWGECGWWVESLDERTLPNAGLPPGECRRFRLVELDEGALK